MSCAVPIRVALTTASPSAAAAPVPAVADALPVHAHCDRCAALCCRLTVVLAPGDHVPAELTELTADGLTVMARGSDGRCVANRDRRCSIYATRPGACRRFVMDGPYCRAITEDDWLDRHRPKVAAG